MYRTAEGQMDHGWADSRWYRWMLINCGRQQRLGAGGDTICRRGQSEAVTQERAVKRCGKPCRPSFGGAASPDGLSHFAQ